MNKHFYETMGWEFIGIFCFSNFISFLNYTVHLFSRFFPALNIFYRHFVLFNFAVENKNKIKTTNVEEKHILRKYVILT